MLIISRPHIVAAAATAAKPLRSHLRHRSSIAWQPLPILSDPSPIAFREKTFSANRPIKVPSACLSPPFPAIQKWFSPADSDSTSSAGSVPNYAYLDPFASSTFLPIELVTTTTTTTKEHNEGGESNDNNNNNTDFQRVDSAPLSLWLNWAKLILSSPSPSSSSPSTQPSLYISQSPLHHLPPTLQSDLSPPPSLILSTSTSTSDSKHNPSRNIYASNLWMGVGGTYTPLHRDANPNLLVQLAGGKVVRLIEPGGESGEGVGEEWFAGVKGMDSDTDDKAPLSSSSSSSPYHLTLEMMHGRKRAHLHDLVWSSSSSTSPSPSFPPTSSTKNSSASDSYIGYETTLLPNEGLFIPAGWWHSVKGIGGVVTASVNWWFR